MHYIFVAYDVSRVSRLIVVSGQWNVYTQATYQQFTIQYVFSRLGYCIHLQIFSMKMALPAVPLAPSAGLSLPCD